MLTTTHVLEMTRTSVTQLYLPLIATAGEPATSAAVKTGVIWWHALNQELRRVGWCVLNVTKSAWSRLSGWKYHCKLLQLRRQTRLSKWHVICNDIKSSRTSWPRGQKFRPRPWTRPRRIVLRLGLGIGLEHLSSACPRTFYFRLVKMSVMMELVIIVSLQWLSTKVIYLLTLCYWYKLVQVHVHGSIQLFRGSCGIHWLSIDSENRPWPRPQRFVLI